MRLHPASQHRQKGATAVVLGLILLVVFSMGGVVVDLGHMYIAKAELQTVADSAALAGALELDQTAAGINSAVAKGQAIAAKNKYNFSSSASLDVSRFSFGASPSGPWLDAGAAGASPGGLSFVKVDTGDVAIDTYLMRVGADGVNAVSVGASAVAGRFVHDITPIGVCAADPTSRTDSYTYPSGASEIVEFGFRRGVAYNLLNLGSLGGATSDPYQINPLDAPPHSCNSSNSSTATMAPYMCTGKSAVLSTGIGQVYTNTGVSAGLDKALNSRFNDYSGGSRCDPASAPPDVNIMEYPCKGGGAGCASNSPPTIWMQPGANALPSQQAVSVTAAKVPNYQFPANGALPSPAGFAQFSEYGPLWAYGPAYHATSGAPAADTPFTAAEANLNPMYSSSVPVAPDGYIDTAQYPTTPGSGFPAGTVGAPYNQTGNASFFTAPAGHAGQPERRVLNVVLVDCRTPPVGSASCGVMNTVGIGRFFMLTKADFSGAGTLNAEFIGLVSPSPTSEIKLYR
ncbi:MAG: Tad domain-containing protein [Pseudomonadota bacterium]